MAFVNGALAVGQTDFVGGASTCATRRAESGRTAVTMRASGLSKALVLARRSRGVADQYMEDTIARTYKSMTMQGGGIYSTQCAEGASKGAADTARVRVLSARFRNKQIPEIEKRANMFENRRLAIMNSHGCNYEEKLFSKNPLSAAAYVTKKREAMLVCDRYASPMSVEENYMAQSVENQMKARAVPMGVYSTKCSDGAWKDHSEAARVSALSTAYRTGQMSTLAREAAAYNTRQFAIANYGHGCTYEEDLFTKYPAIAGTMK